MSEESKKMVVVSQQSAMQLAFTEDQKKLIKDTICRGASDDELKLFMYTAQKTGLDPLARQIYAVKRFDKKLNREVMAIQTSIDGFRLIAERSDRYEGQVGPFWCGEDGVWKDVWLDDKNPRAAKVGVWKKNFREALFGIATWDEYMQEFKDQAGNWHLSPMWRKMPALMLAKCAESLALRKAFPQELSNLYTTEEMQQAQNHETNSNDAHSPIQQPPVQPASVWQPSKKQLDRLFAISHAAGWDTPEVKAFMKERYNIESSKDLNREQYDNLCAHLEANKKPPKPATQPPVVEGEFANYDTPSTLVK